MRKGLLAICLVSASDARFLNMSPLPAGGISAWKRTGKNWVPVPVQIDERDRNGDYVLEHGLPFTADGGDGLFNAQDEMVFDLPAESNAAGDFTDAAATSFLAQREKKGRRTGRAMRVVVTAGSRTIPLLVTSGGIPDPVQSAVWFDPGAKTIDAPGYRYWFNQKNPAAIGRLEIPDSGKNPFKTVNHGGGFAAWIRPPWLYPVLRRTNEDLESAVESWRTGPVRAIVAVGSKYSAFWSLVKAHLFSELVFYRDRFQIPSVVDIHFSPGKLTGRGSGFAYALELDGKVTPRMEESRTGPARVSVTHESGLVLSATVDRGLARAGTMPQVWIRDEAEKNGPGGIPEDVKGWFRASRATTGFFVDISRMERGRYDFALDLESRAGANESHTDFLTCKSVWTSMAPTQTSRPATKQE